jgi:hypothetical protein
MLISCKWQVPRFVPFGGSSNVEENGYTTKVSFAGISADEKVQLLGDEFRNIAVLDFESTEGVMCTRIIFDGQVIMLIGDPQEALKTYLGGTGNETAQ